MVSALMAISAWVVVGTGGPPQPGYQLVIKPCQSNPTYSAQNWAVASPGKWPAGSWAPEQPNIINTDTGLCVDTQGSFPGWPARAWPCSTSNQPEYWGDRLAAVTSSVWYSLASSAASATKGGASSQDESVQLVTNVSEHGTWHQPGAKATGHPTGLVCLTSSMPLGGDWHYPANTVGTWFCDGVAPVQWRIQSNPPRIVSAENESLCLESVPAVPKVPQHPVPTGSNGTNCPSGCSGPPCSTMPFCDSRLSPNVRARDLVSRLSNEEKGLAMLGLGKSDAITQLGLPTMWMFSGEAQHGLVRGCMNGTVCPTSFPSLVGIGATGNKSLFTAIGDAISDEARAWFNILGVTKNANLCVWAPNINLARNFLWGRNEETPGEDPTINGVYGSLFISAMQDGVEAVDWDNASAPLLKTAPTLKHFLAYDVDCTNGHSEGGYFGCAAPGVDRFHFEAIIPSEDYVSYYVPVMAKPISESKPAAIMCAFNTINGTPGCADAMSLTTLARDTYGFDGFVVSDCGGIDFLNQGHYLSTSPAGATSMAIKAGCEVECGTPGPWGPGYYFRDYSADAVAEGLLRQSDVDTALVKKWRTAFRLGIFDKGAPTPWSHLGMEDIHSSKHQALTLSAAEQSMTLLKNKDGILPLNLSKYRKIAILGPAQNITTDMKGGYSGTTVPILSPGAVLAARLGGDRLVWAEGTSRNDTVNIPMAVTAVSAADVDLAIIFVQDTYVGEQADRTDIALQYGQQQLVKAIGAVGKPVVLVIIAGHTLAIEAENEVSDAVLFAFLPSEAGGTAIVNTLLGDSAPSGRLPITLYPRSILFERDPGDMSLRGGPGITYLHYPTNKTVYPFGYGLSYSRFNFAWADAALTSGSSRIDTQSNFTTLVLPQIRVTNIGTVRSAVTINGFIVGVRIPELDSDAPAPPNRELFDFGKVLLSPGESVNVALELPASIVAIGTASGDLMVMAGEYDLALGGLPLLEGAARTTLTVHGPKHAVFSLEELRARHALSLLPK